MTNNAFSVASAAACPQLPSGVERELCTSRTEHRQATRLVDILAISDNPTLGLYLSELFAGSGWTIVCAHTWEAGVSLIKDNRVAVAVCEDSLPGKDWQEAAAELRSLPGSPALVVIGGEPGLASEVLAAGGFDALVRPLRESEVVWVIASAWHCWLKCDEDDGKGALRCSGT
jgi:CheY-like chemotaxis protein